MTKNEVLEKIKNDDLEGMFIQVEGNGNICISGISIWKSANTPPTYNDLGKICISKKEIEDYGIDYNKLVKKFL